MGCCMSTPGDGLAEGQRAKSAAPTASTPIMGGAAGSKPRLNRAGTILGRETPVIDQIYRLGRELGRGQFGTTYEGKLKADPSKTHAVKKIEKAKVRNEDDREDIRREVAIMHHLAGHPNIIHLRGAYEDSKNVYLAMDVCEGGELYDRIVSKRDHHYTEADAAETFKQMLTVIAHCHKMGVIHRDLKPENFLMASKSPDAPVVAADFGLSVFFKPGQRFRELVGSPYYVAPEVLRHNYSHEADIWSIGVILYILLCGVPPFWGKSDRQIFDQILDGHLDLQSDPWPKISKNAHDLVKKMLKQNPKERLSAQDALNHPWLNGGASGQVELGSEVLNRLKKFAKLSKFKKLGLFALAKTMSEEEITGLKKIFAAMDQDGSGTVNVEELRSGLKKQGCNLAHDELSRLIAEIDVDGDHELDYNEFTAATLHLSKLTNEENLHKAFSHFDKDESGYITKDELEAAIIEGGMVGKVSVQEILDDVDKDGDGKINYDEFVSLMRSQTMSDSQYQSTRMSVRTLKV